jgi:hypothetical protein
MFRTSFAAYGIAFDSARMAEADFDAADLRQPFNWISGA